MSRNDDDLTREELTAMFADPAWAAKYPPILTVDEAAALLRVPKQTVYDWHSRGLLKGCCHKVGKHLRFLRDRLLKLKFNGK